MIYLVNIVTTIVLIGIVVYQTWRNGRLASKNRLLKKENTALFSTLRIETTLSVEQINVILEDINPDNLDPNKFTDRMRKKFRKKKST